MDTAGFLQPRCNSAVARTPAQLASRLQPPQRSSCEPRTGEVAYAACLCCRRPRRKRIDGKPCSPRHVHGRCAGLAVSASRRGSAGMGIRRARSSVEAATRTRSPRLPLSKVHHGEGRGRSIHCIASVRTRAAGSVGRLRNGRLAKEPRCGSAERRITASIG